MVGVEGWLDIRRVDVVRKEEGGDEGDSQHRRERENDEDERKRKINGTSVLSRFYIQLKVSFLKTRDANEWMEQVI